jgi:hypothetical protein
MTSHLVLVAVSIPPPHQLHRLQHLLLNRHHLLLLADVVIMIMKLIDKLSQIRYVN